MFGVSSGWHIFPRRESLSASRAFAGDASLPPPAQTDDFPQKHGFLTNATKRLDSLWVIDLKPMLDACAPGVKTFQGILHFDCSRKGRERDVEWAGEGDRSGHIVS